ncbi:MAG: LysE family translocator [Leptothrix sp. (in: b-proteobacteria)]
MSPDTLLAFSLFALVTSITPGPNNFMLLASGVNFGFRSSVPHMLGISSGFLLMVLAVGLGLAEVFSQLPWVYGFLKWVGAIYMLYLAWCVATSGPLEDKPSHGRLPKPMSFWGAAAFQWVNPKAWIMAVGAFSTYVPASSGFVVIACVAALFAVINLPSVGVWALFGSSLRHVLQVRRNLLAFNYSMAGLLVVSLYPLLHVS